jgi:hypothetical protein
MAEKVKADTVVAKQKPSYLIAMEDKWLKWTGINEPDIFEAINDFSGDLYLEMRKLTSKVCTEIEARSMPDDFKAQMKDMIDETWRNIIDHQKIGLDKLCIVVKKHLKE